MNFLLDTNICIYFLKGKFELVGKIEKIGIDSGFISEITIAELKFGIENSTFPGKNRAVVEDMIKRFKHLPIFNVLDVYAKEKARLKKEGKIVDDLDLFIGATAIANDMVLVTNNERHFERLNNIRIENWTNNNSSTL
jgi:tRNA(fMet)-specific endonuclease VapC